MLLKSTRNNLFDFLNVTHSIYEKVRIKCEREQ